MSENSVLGAEILSLVTAGMYDDPLVIYREYLQNSADAIFAQGDGAGCVTLQIDVHGSSIRILDSGVGLRPEHAAQRLIPIGRSAKNRTRDRGFRGIGRLAALAFADRVRFTTRNRGGDQVTQVTWDGRALREKYVNETDASAVVEECVSICSVDDEGRPECFFEVLIEGVARHAASSVLNVDAVRGYIGEICPVPLSSSFPFQKNVEEMLKAHGVYFSMKTFLKGDEKTIERPFEDAVQLSDDCRVSYDKFEKREVPSIDGDAPAAIVWLAHTSYRGSIPRHLRIRGLRVRVGNIQVGNERAFEDLFTEPRFNGWCIGEVNILDSRIVPNGRRDYFEPGPHLRNLEYHVGAIAQEISARCRKASSQRNRVRAIGKTISRLEEAHNLAVSGYLSRDDAVDLMSRERQAAPDDIMGFLGSPSSGALVPRIQEISELMEELEVAESDELVELMGSAPSEIVDIYRSIFSTIARFLPPNTAKSLIELILESANQEQSKVVQTGARVD